MTPSRTEEGQPDPWEDRLGKGTPDRKLTVTVPRRVPIVDPARKPWLEEQTALARTHVRTAERGPGG